jgi:RNA polymerase primary sigma factor
MSKTDFCLSLFLHDIEAYKQLSHEKTMILVQKYKESYDSNYLNDIVLGNIRFIISKANRYKTNRISISDLIYAGMLGIFKAAKKFDPKRNIRFITYASYWIDMCMRRECIYCSSIVRHSPRAWELSSKMARLQLEGASETEILRVLNIRRKTLRNIRKLNCDMSLDSITRIDNEQNLEAVFIEPEVPDEICADNDLSDYLYRLVDKLKDREKEILYSRFGLRGYTPLNMRQISYYQRLTPERVRQIINSSLKKLKKNMKKDII